MTNGGRMRRTRRGASIEPTMNASDEGTVQRPACQRRQPEHQLQVLRDEEEGPEGDEEAEDVDRQRRAERGRAEQPQIDQRVGQLALPAHEGDADREAGHDRKDRQPAEARFGDLLEAVDHRQHGDQRQRRADKVEPARLRIADTPAAASARRQAAAPSRGRRAGTPSPTRTIAAARRRSAARSRRRPRSW